MFTSPKNFEKKFQLKKYNNETKNGKVVARNATIVANLSITY